MPGMLSGRLPRQPLDAPEKILCVLPGQSTNTSNPKCNTPNKAVAKNHK